MNDFLEKTTLSMKGLVNFFEQFGDDVHSRELLDVLFDLLMNEEDVVVNGEPEVLSQDEVKNE